jgi:hypothetical protein
MYIVCGYLKGFDCFDMAYDGCMSRGETKKKSERIQAGKKQPGRAHRTQNAIISNSVTSPAGDPQRRKNKCTGSHREANI